MYFLLLRYFPFAIFGNAIEATSPLIEALTLGDRIGVMNEGELVAIGTAAELDGCEDPYVRGLLDAPKRALVQLVLELESRPGGLDPETNGADIVVYSSKQVDVGGNTCADGEGRALACVSKNASSCGSVTKC